MEKNNNRFKKLEIEKRGGKEESSTELQKPNIEVEVYDNNKKVWLRKKEKTKLKSLIKFLSANKIDNYNRGGKKGKQRKSKRIYRTSKK